MNDQNFPLIQYRSPDFAINGQAHGESFRSAIQELAAIRRQMMGEKNPKIIPYIPALAQEQFVATRNFAPHLAKELEGLAAGAGLTIEDMIILNNYTDFRDISLSDEGCSAVHVQRDHLYLSGQTWDMHQSAKNFVCAIEIKNDHQNITLFSLVGCLGMMGANHHGLFIGVNNINTTNARAGILWPALVRKCLESETFQGLRTTLTTASVTSGHNYLISSPQGGEMWEIGVNLQEQVSALSEGQNGEIFHTNHCLSKAGQDLEDARSSNSTTFNRFAILEKKLPQVQSREQIEALLKDHEGYPKSICSHFESGAQDPSMTCGGGVFNSLTREFKLWRGCELYEKNYKEYRFTLA